MSVSCQIFKTLLFILFSISIDVFRRGTPCIDFTWFFVCFRLPWSKFVD